MINTGPLWSLEVGCPYLQLASIIRDTINQPVFISEAGRMDWTITGGSELVAIKTALDERGIPNIPSWEHPAE